MRTITLLIILVFLIVSLPAQRPVESEIIDPRREALDKVRDDLVLATRAAKSIIDDAGLTEAANPNDPAIQIYRILSAIVQHKSSGRAFDNLAKSNPVDENDLSPEQIAIYKGSLRIVKDREISESEALIRTQDVRRELETVVETIE